MLSTRESLPAHGIGAPGDKNILEVGCAGSVISISRASVPPLTAEVQHKQQHHSTTTPSPAQHHTAVVAQSQVTQAKAYLPWQSRPVEGIEVFDINLSQHRGDPQQLWRWCCSCVKHKVSSWPQRSSSSTTTTMVVLSTHAQQQRLSTSHVSSAIVGDGVMAGQGRPAGPKELSGAGAIAQLLHPQRETVGS